MLTSRTDSRPVIDETDRSAHASRASVAGELYLCLANALQVPRDPAFIRALRDELGGDLATIADELGRSDLGSPIAELQDRLGVLDDDPLPLLQAYSALFLTPPVPAPLNAGIYLDGAPMGPTTLELERCYYHYGVDRAETFPGMPDHLALLLEFAAFLHFRAAGMQERGDDTAAARLISEAGRFLQRYVASWLRDWIRRMDAADVNFTHVRLYRQLGRVLETAVLGDVEQLLEGVDADVPQPAQASRDGVAAAIAAVEDDEIESAICRNCGRAMELQGDLAVIHRKLTAAGLAADHVAICPECRGSSSGMQPLKPVRVPGQRR